MAKLHVFSQQAAASCLLPSLHSTSPYHSPAPTQSDTAYVKRNVTHEPRQKKPHTAQTVLDGLVVAWGSDASIYIPAKYPIMSNLEILLYNILFGYVGNITLRSLEGRLTAVLVYTDSAIPGMTGHCNRRG